MHGRHIHWYRDHKGNVRAQLAPNSAWWRLRCQAPNATHEQSFIASFTHWAYCLSCGVTLRPKRRAA